MAFGPQKVWVIGPSKNDKQTAPSEQSKTQTEPPGQPMTPPQLPEDNRPVRPAVQTPRTGKSWRPLLFAYLAGPVMLTIWSKGRRRIAWATIGGGSVAAGSVLLLFRSSFTAWLDAAPNGLLLWLVLAPALILSVATAWTRAIAVAGCQRPAPLSQLPRWVRDPRTIGVLGMLIPGLGLMFAGHPKRAAWSLWIVGPMAVALTVLFNWRWLWDRGQSPVPAGISASAVETTLLVAAGIAVAAILTWIVQALDGARRASTGRQSAASDVAWFALLIAFALLFFTVRPVSFAADLHSASTTMRNEGFRLLPLVLCEAATRLDPVTPVYLAHAAELNEELGMKHEAATKNEIIERRARQYNEIVGANVGGEGVYFAPYLNAFRPFEVEDRGVPDNVYNWERATTPQ